MPLASEARQEGFVGLVGSLWASLASLGLPKCPHERLRDCGQPESPSGGRGIWHCCLGSGQPPSPRSNARESRPWTFP